MVDDVFDQYAYALGQFINSCCDFGLEVDSSGNIDNFHNKGSEY